MTIPFAGSRPTRRVRTFDNRARAPELVANPDVGAPVTKQAAVPGCHTCSALGPSDGGLINQDKWQTSAVIARGLEPQPPQFRLITTAI